jgi:hypothetical protein
MVARLFPGPALWVAAGPDPGKSRVQLLSMIDFEEARSPSLGSFDPCAACFVIRYYKVHVTHAQRASEFKEGHNRRIAPASFQIAYILLGKPGGFGKTLLSEAFFLPYPPEISADQLAHVHVRKLRLYIL